MLVHRQKGTPEADLVSKKPRGYICGMSLAQSHKYYPMVASLKALIQQGEVTTKGQAKAYLYNQLEP